MIVIPAIDILDGQCVRLKEGKFTEKTVYFQDPVDAAKHWRNEGARRLHVVDLDGARAGKPINVACVANIVKAMGNIPVQIGGGIRDMAGLAAYFAVGIHAAILGTAAVNDRAFFSEACRTYPGKVIAGLDARGEIIAVDGWEKNGGVNLFECADWVAEAGAEAIIYTDINRDGMLSGVNAGQLEKLSLKSRVPVIASGGVANMDDIKTLLASAGKIFGVISGRALYQETLNLNEAQTYIDTAAKQQS